MLSAVGINFSVVFSLALVIKLNHAWLTIIKYQELGLCSCGVVPLLTNPDL